MRNFVFYCKSYIKDLKSITSLVKSFKKYNVENIHMYISVPKSDFEDFRQFNSENITVIKDEDYALSYLVEKNVGRFSAGYINQEICKLSFWESNFALNYLCVDSDACFIRDFKYEDFTLEGYDPHPLIKGVVAV